MISNIGLLKESAAVNDFLKPDRIFLDTDNLASMQALEALYAPFNRNHDKIVHMDRRAAEPARYAANVMLATHISSHFIHAGGAYGGSCFPKDVRALIPTAETLGYELVLIRGSSR